MKVTESLRGWDSIYDDGSIELPLQTLQSVRGQYHISSAWLDELFGVRIEENAMTHGGIEIPPNNHDGVLFDAILIALELAILPGMSLESQTAQQLVRLVFHRKGTPTVAIRLRHFLAGM